MAKLIPRAASEPPRIISDFGVNNSPDGSSSGTPAKAEENGMVVVASNNVCRTWRRQWLLDISEGLSSSLVSLSIVSVGVF